jgi:hypothetical protein
MQFFGSIAGLILLVFGGAQLGEQLKLEDGDFLIPIILMGCGIGLPVIFFAIPELAEYGDCADSEPCDSSSTDYETCGGDGFGDGGGDWI